MELDVFPIFTNEEPLERSHLILKSSPFFPHLSIPSQLPNTSFLLSAEMICQTDSVDFPLPIFLQEMDPRQKKGSGGW